MTIQLQLIIFPHFLSSTHENFPYKPYYTNIFHVNEKIEEVYVCILLD